MPDPLISKPLAGLVAFQQSGTEAEWSRAAQLIALGVQLIGDRTAVEGIMVEGAELAFPIVAALEGERIGWSGLESATADLPVPAFFSALSTGMPWGEWENFEEYLDLVATPI